MRCVQHALVRPTATRGRLALAVWLPATDPRSLYLIFLIAIVRTAIHIPSMWMVYEDGPWPETYIDCATG